MTYTLHLGDCLDVMRTLEPNSVDAIVTDPPYGLAFMGKAWDHAVPGPEFFAEMLRVAKPGAHLFAFGGTRLYHRMTCAIEDAGWEVRDCLSWLYGSGFPKSLAIDKAIDRANGDERPVVGMSAHKPGIANGTRGHTTVGGTFAQHVPITSAASALALLTDSVIPMIGSGIPKAPSIWSRSNRRSCSNCISRWVIVLSFQVPRSRIATR